MHRIPLLLAASAALTLSATAQSVTDDFEGGSNADLWQIDDNPPATWMATGGNPNGRLEVLMSSAAAFLPAPLFHPTAPGHPWGGDYRATGVFEFNYDRQVEAGAANFGTQPYVLLGDDNGTPGDFIDDAWVWVSTGDNYQFGFVPWTTISVQIPSQSPTLPATWGFQALPNSPMVGMSGDQVWNAIITDVDYLGITASLPWNGGTWFGNHTLSYDNFELNKAGLGPAIGSTYCQGQPNSTGVPAAMTVNGSDVVSDNDVTLNCGDMPLNQFGYFLTGQTQGFTPNPGGSQGNICLAGNIGRYNLQIGDSGSTGTISALVDLNTMPVNPVQMVMVGETWNFQCWYRDLNPGNTSNFSNAVAVTFQ